MLDFDTFAPAYQPHVQDNDPCLRLQQMQADPLAYSPYSPPYSPAGGYTLKPPLTPPVPTFASLPGPQSFNFDPFADEDSSTSSGASERERELEAQRLHRIEFLRRREWMRRVVAWVDGISHGMVSKPLTSNTPPSGRSAPDCFCQGNQRVILTNRTLITDTHIITVTDVFIKVRTFPWPLQIYPAP